MAKHTFRKLKIPVLALSVLLFYSTGLMAYIDPGTGSYIFQVAVTLAAGAIFGVKVFWKNIVNFFSSVFKKKRGGK
jgi:hypothetical protein